jgi:DNA mismatch endonuclease, patch repair protein
MQTQRQKNTKPELLIRSELHRRGLRFFVDRAPLTGLGRRADLVFPRGRVAVYVDGCFWHGCPIHGTWPKNNAQWWREKIEANRARDRDTDRRLRDAGWLPVRVWEHESAVVAADQIVAAVADRRYTRS